MLERQWSISTGGVFPLKTIISLWSGTGSQHAAWEDAGYDVISCDIDGTFDPTFEMDIIHLTADMIKEKMRGRRRPLWLWASPDCSVWSVANFRAGHFCQLTREPRTEKANYMHRRLDHTLKLIKKLNPYFWLIENPVGLMRKMKVMKKFPRHTVTYCQYGDERMKPTDLFGHPPIGWYPRKCRVGASCHVASPRRVNTGTQALSKADRGRIPYGLGESLVKATSTANLHRHVNLYDYMLRGDPTLQSWL